MERRQTLRGKVTRLAQHYPERLPNTLKIMKFQNRLKQRILEAVILGGFATITWRTLFPKIGLRIRSWGIHRT